MACCCLSSPHNPTFETSLTTRLTTNTTTISLAKLTTEESESEEFGPKLIEKGRAVGTVVRARRQLDMLDRVVVFLTRIVASKEQRYLGKTLPEAQRSPKLGIISKSWNESKFQFSTFSLPALPGDHLSRLVHLPVILLAHHHLNDNRYLPMVQQHIYCRQHDHSSQGPIDRTPETPGSGKKD